MACARASRSAEAMAAAEVPRLTPADPGRPPTTIDAIRPMMARTISSSSKVNPRMVTGLQRQLIEAQHGDHQRGDDAGDDETGHDGDHRHHKADQALHALAHLL